MPGPSDLSNDRDAYDVLDRLAVAIRTMNPTEVPPPVIFNGVGNIKDFFISFERFCRSKYGDNYDSYLVVLPTYLAGEAKNIAQSFGTGSNVSYNTVKNRLIAEHARKSLGRNNFTDFFSATRLPSESLVCLIATQSDWKP